MNPEALGTVEYTWYTVETANVTPVETIAQPESCAVNEPIGRIHGRKSE
jgi:hypothetical protein